MPDGIRCSTVFLPPTTSVWPALWPPWKRTTPCARSVSQSTILPLPSSPHWVPMTTTFLAAMVHSPLFRIRADQSQLAQIQTETGGRTRPAEYAPDLVVAPALRDRMTAAGRIGGEDDAAVVAVAAKFGEIVRHLDAGKALVDRRQDVQRGVDGRQ